MRTIVLGGTRFVGRAVVDELLAAGHEPLVVHRGEHEPPEPSGFPHLHVDRRSLASKAGELRRFSPEGLVDLSAMTAEDAETALDTLPEGLSMVVASSIDVYRAFASVWAGTLTDDIPLTEESPLRTGPPPDSGYVTEGYDYEPSRYEKLDVETRYLARGAAVCRLPMVYGPHDYKRREAFVLSRIRAGRKRIPIGAGAWLWSRGHVAELARAIRLALEHPSARGEVFNLCESECAPIRTWMEWIADAAEASIEFVRVPDQVLPEDLEITGGIPQHWLASAEKAQDVLGWAHAEPRATTAGSVRWHLAHPPGDEVRNFARDERALAAAS